MSATNRGARLVPLPVHPAQQVREALSVHSQLRAEGFSGVHAAHLSRYFSRAADADPVRARIDANLGKAFDRDELASLVDEELRPHLLAEPAVLIAASGRRARGGPGAEELWEKPWIYHPYKEFSEIYFGQDWEDLSDRQKAHSQLVYEDWLDHFVAAREDIKEFLQSIEMSIADLMAIINAIFANGGTALQSLLDNFKAWLFHEIGFSL